MRKRTRFRPESLDRLESKILLTQGGPITPALIGTLSPKRPASGLAQVYAQVNASFNRFTQDYQQAQGAYLSSSTEAARKAFQSFGSERVGLLSQELVRTLSRLPGSYAPLPKSQRTNDQWIALQWFLNQSIIGTNAATLQAKLKSENILPPAGTTGSSATLYTLSASNAITSARVATIHALKYFALNPSKK